MTLCNVHIYREMRLLFTDIEAESPETAAAIARDKLTREAAEIDECDGQTLAGGLLGPRVEKLRRLISID
ncbi:MAG: hypothetical protein KatS3mg108_0683 [Isosphaeraceae bacterium]|jgi:hypothetical protein|nr:MAG: hypothetical protein KatS3mg108_0683 [Isosphaeraceae bacterium]